MQMIKKKSFLFEFQMRDRDLLELLRYSDFVSIYIPNNLWKSENACRKPSYMRTYENYTHFFYKYTVYKHN